MVYKLFHKKSWGSGANHEIKRNEQLAEELYKAVIKTFQKIKTCSPFRDNIWGADLADMQLISKFNKGIRFLLCVIDIFSKYAWAIPLKYRKSVTIVNTFQNNLNSLNKIASKKKTKENMNR